MECEICHNTSAGVHYRAIACRACAAFFRRTVYLKLRYYCKKDGKCMLNKETRFTCRFCRMKKCLEMGMTMEDTPMNSADFQLHSDSPDSSPPSLDEDNFYSGCNVIEKHEEFMEELKIKVKEILATNPKPSGLPYKLSLCQQALSAYVKYKAKWPNCSKENQKDCNDFLKMKLDGVVEMVGTMCDYYKQREHVAEFCMELEPFLELSEEQKLIVFNDFADHFPLLDGCFVAKELLGCDPDDQRLVSLNGQVIHYQNSKYDISGISDCTEEELKSAFSEQENICQQTFVKPFKKVNPDQFEFIYLLLARMWNFQDEMNVSNETKEVAQTVKKRLSEELHYYYEYDKKMENYASRIYKLHDLLTASDRLDELKREASRSVCCLRIAETDGHLDQRCR